MSHMKEIVQSGINTKQYMLKNKKNDSLIILMLHRLLIRIYFAFFDILIWTFSDFIEIIEETILSTL